MGDGSREGRESVIASDWMRLWTGDMYQDTRAAWPLELLSPEGDCLFQIMGWSNGYWA